MKILFQTSTLAILSMVGIAKYVPRLLKASSVPTSFVNKACDFGDHPNQTVLQHLSSTRHQNASKNKSAYDKLRKRHGNVWKMMQYASLASEVQKTQTNRFILKSFFRITWVFISKNWAHTHNFKTLADLVSACGGKELQTHLLISPKNATFMSPDFLPKYIQIMDEHLKIPLLASLKCRPFTFFSDETQETTSTEQLAIYATFEHAGKIKVHFIGILPVSKLVGMMLSAQNIIKVLVEVFESIEVSISSCCFSCMDTTRRIKTTTNACCAFVSLDWLWKSQACLML